MLVAPSARGPRADGVGAQRDGRGHRLDAAVLGHERRRPHRDEVDQDALRRVPGRAGDHACARLDEEGGRVEVGVVVSRPVGMAARTHFGDRPLQGARGATTCGSTELRVQEADGLVAL